MLELLNCFFRFDEFRLFFELTTFDGGQMDEDILSGDFLFSCLSLLDDVLL
jgi:hypothetical protein